MGLSLKFEFATSNRIIFGDGTLEKIEGIGAKLGRKALVICGSGSVSLSRLMGMLKKAGIDNDIFRVSQ